MGWLSGYIKHGEHSRMIRNLKNGDEVTWTDPDNGTCTKTITIHEIHIKSGIVCITDTNGDYLECFASELS